MVPKTMSGSAFEKVTRNMVDNLTMDFKEFKHEIRNEFKDLKNTNVTLYNHLSARVPPWVTIVLTIGASLLTGVIMWGLSR